MSGKCGIMRKFYSIRKVKVQTRPRVKDKGILKSSQSNDSLKVMTKFSGC